MLHREGYRIRVRYGNCDRGRRGGGGVGKRLGDAETPALLLYREHCEENMHIYLYLSLSLSLSLYIYIYIYVCVCVCVGVVYVGVCMWV